jgi:hypothetical protein
MAGFLRHISIMHLSAQNQEVEPIGPRFRAGCLPGGLDGPAESLFAAEEFLFGEIAHRGVGASLLNPAAANAWQVCSTEG